MFLCRITLMQAHQEKPMYRSLTVLLCAAALAAATQGSFAAARAADSVLVKRIAVRYGDLDIEKPAAAALLRRRIESAAIRACGGRAQFHTFYQAAPQFISRDFEACRANAVDKALADVGTARFSRPVTEAR
jgi:UrcA family protein